jgi:hypothetical protein
MENCKQKNTGGVEMKKVLLSLVLGLVVMFSMSTAQAAILDGWRLDLSGYGGGNNTDINHINLAGDAVVDQSFGGNGTLDVGDTFTEDFLLEALTYKLESSSGNALLGLPAGLVMYAYGIDITGAVTVIKPNGEFEYSFDTLQSVSLVLDTDFDPTTVSYTLGVGTILSPSGGIGNPGFLGGAGINGTTNMTLAMTYLTGSTWYTAGGQDLSLLPAGYVTLGLVNTNNLTEGATPYNDGVVVDVFSNGQLNLNVIPEPTSMLLLGGGLLGLFGASRKKKKA